MYSVARTRGGQRADIARCEALLALGRAAETAPPLACASTVEVERRRRL